MKNFQIAIDGPAGAGKSTIAQEVAKRLGYIYIDTGAMYRAMGLFFDQNESWPKGPGEIEALVEKAEISIKAGKDGQGFFLNGENVSKAIRTEKAGMSASSVSKLPQVRKKMVELQQKMAESMNVVMDGRDIGTVVLPNAQLKIFLTAEVCVRAKRRMLQLKEKGIEGNLQEIEEDIKARDHQDMTREHSPLKQAEDAVLLDTSYMTIEEAVGKIMELQKEKAEK